MKIRLEDFTYKGKRHNHFELDIPDHVNLDEVPLEKVFGYVIECFETIFEHDDI